MEVEFRRTGERRYAITIHRKDQPPLVMDPAPGYDPLMPHDLLHLVVESELGLRHGIFGQVAEGGNAGTFHSPPAAGESPRQAARRRRRDGRRGDRLLREGSDEAAQSERATYICLYEWLARSADSARRSLAAGMSPQARQTRELLPRAERETMSEAFLRRVCKRLDELSARWSSLEVGESLTLEWPARS